MRANWCPKRDSNSQNLGFESSTYTNSVIGAINTNMKPYKEIELIELLLRKVQPKFQNSGELLAWQRGYLTGLLATLAHNDSAIRSQLIKKYNRGADGKS
jgi:hypothetical protein